MFAIQQKPRRCSGLFCAISVSAGLLLAADPSWKNKPIPNWTEEDARQILTRSPWSKSIVATINPRQGEFERREGGNMGQATGVGFDGIDEKKGRSSSPARRSLTLQIRWESALPIRAAELKSRVVELPTLEGDGYRIAVYGVPGANIQGDPKTLGDPLRKQAVLRREGKADVKPSRVEVFAREDGLVIVYLFPLSAEISPKDGRIEFNAQIGRLAFAQSFDLGEMQFQGKLEL